MTVVESVVVSSDDGVLNLYNTMSKERRYSADSTAPTLSDASVSTTSEESENEVETKVDVAITSTTDVEVTTTNKTSSSVIRVAILGCGMMGQEHTSYIMGYSDRVRIDYLCDPHQPSIDKCIDVIHEFSRENANRTSNVVVGIPTIVTTEDELYEQYLHNIDLLVVATPNYLHTDILLRWGQHEHLTILVEKPVSVSYDQHTKLSNVATANGVNSTTSIKARVWVAMEYRFIPAIAKLIDLIPSVVGDIKMVTIRENRYPFLHKIGQWNRDLNKTGDSLVEKCCHFFDLMRLITGQEVQLDKVRSLVQRGINYEDEEEQHEIPIIDSAYVILPFKNNKASTTSLPSNPKKALNAVGCLELCMFAEGSRHQEEVIVTGTKGRLEAYLPENKVYSFTRPSTKEWSDRSVPPSKESIEQHVYDCSNVKDIHGINSDDQVPTHGGYHYCSTAVEWYKLLHAMDVYKQTGTWNPLVSLNDGLRAVEIGLQATQSVVL